MWKLPMFGCTDPVQVGADQLLLLLLLLAVCHQLQRSQWPFCFAVCLFSASVNVAAAAQGAMCEGLLACSVLHMCLDLQRQCSTHRPVLPFPLLGCKLLDYLDTLSSLLNSLCYLLFLPLLLPSVGAARD